MRQTIATGELRKMAADRGGGRGPAYNFIWANYRRLVRSKVGVSGGVSWEAFASTLAREGLTNKQGGPLSADSTRKIFRRVSRDFKAEQSAKAGTSTRPTNPSRMPATLRPSVVEPPRAAEPRRYAAPIPHPAQTAPPEVSQKVRDKLALLDRQLDYRDRYLNPPKRKD